MKFEEVENISKALQAERLKNTELLTRYKSITAENDTLKKKLMTMGEDMTKLKNSVKLAFEEEEVTKKNIKELVTAMQDQLTAAQERILEKEKENLELLQILQKVKDMRLLERNGEAMKPSAESVEEEDEEESQEEEVQGDMTQQDKLYQLLSAMQGNIDNRDSVQTGSMHRGMISDRRDVQADEDDYDSEYQPALAPKKKPASKTHTKPAKDSQGLGKTMSLQESTSLKQSTSKTKLSQSKPAKAHQESREDTTQSKKPKSTQSNSKTAIAAKALNTIKRTKENIQKIQDSQVRSEASNAEITRKPQAEPKQVKKVKPRSTEEKVSKEEKAEMLSKMGMISEMASVLKSFESKIKQMQSDMGRLVAK